MNDTKKAWTVLIYSNGNNDLEPESWGSIKDIHSSCDTSAINVVIQAGRAEKSLLEIIRPSFKFYDHDFEWAGVRRYYYTPGGLSLIESMGPANMADAKCLYDFVCWGMENYPAEHYMLILGGHAYQLVGLMPDYSQNMPYIMGFPEMCLTLEKVFERINSKIDVLILDTCYCNCVEIIYELGKSEIPPAKNLLTYVGKGPLGGIPLDPVIEILGRFVRSNDIDLIIKKLVDILEYDLVALKIDHAKLESIKRLCNDISYAYLSNNHEISINPSELISRTDLSYPWHGFITELRALLQSMILHAKKTPGNQSGYVGIQFPDLRINSKLERYCRLSFARDNKWTNLLSYKPLNYDFDLYAEIKMAPLLLPVEAVYTYISMMNASLGKEQWQSILNCLKDYKGWI